MRPQVTAEATRAHAPPAGHRGLAGRVSAGHVLMVVAGVLAFLANFVLLRGGDDSVPVLAAAVDLQPGRLVGGGDLRTVRLSAGGEVLGSLIAGDALDTVVGKVVVRRLSAGELFRPDDLGTPAASLGRRAMAVPVEPDHAVGGSLRVGDRIDVIAVASGLAEYVLSAAEVLDVSSGDRGAFAAPGSFYVVVAVDADGALRLAEAIRAGTLEVVRSTGSRPPSEQEG